MFLNISWRELFSPSLSFWEILIRGTVIYFFLYILLRIQKREAGSLETNDLLVVVLLADASQNAMSGSYSSITDGVLLVAVIIMWSNVLNWLSFHFPIMEKILRPPKMPLINEGKMIRKNMKREFISVEELMSELRKNGIEEVSNVQRAFMESDGSISIISTEDYQKSKAKDGKKKSIS